jgi:hypothetical protein
MLLQIPIIFVQIQIEESFDSGVENNNSGTVNAFLPMPNSTAQFIERNEHGGSWLDSFDTQLGIGQKNSSILIDSGKAVFSPVPTSFILTSTSDFDSGSKTNVSTNSDEASIPSGEFQMTPIVVLRETFDAPDELELTKYNPDWIISNPSAGTAKVDQNKKYGGNASLRLLTKTATSNPYYMGAYTKINHSGLEFYMNYDTSFGNAQFSYCVDYNVPTSAGKVTSTYGSTGGKIRYYDGKTMYETGSTNKNTWYKYSLHYNFATQRYNGHIDGGAYTNYHVAKNCAFYNTFTDAWSQYFEFVSATAWSGVYVTTWFDNVTVFGYPLEASFESNTINLPSDNNLRNITLEHYNLTSVSEISKVQFLVGGSVKAEYDVDISSGLKTIIREGDLTSGSFKDIDGDFTIKVHLSSNGARSPAVTAVSGNFEPVKGSMVSAPITLDPDSNWDALILEKTVPAGGALNISILNETGFVIPGFEDISTEGEIDISTIDSSIYQTLKLKASFSGSVSINPSLDYWGVSWNRSNAWRDTFFGGLKISSSDGINTNDGETTTESMFLYRGYINSTIIEVPMNHHFDTMLVNTSEPLGTDINITIFKARNETPIPGFVDITGSVIDLSTINTALFPRILLKAVMMPFGNITPTIYDWSVNWTENRTAPSGNGSMLIDIDPDTLNLKSKGKWITCYIEPQDGKDPAEINISTILLNGTVPAELHPATVGDYDNDSLPDLMVKFNRSDVQNIVSVGENVTLYVEGYYNDGTYFKGFDIIRVINPPEDKHDNGKGKDKNKDKGNNGKNNKK